jgi:hypothetical protein
MPPHHVFKQKVDDEVFAFEHTEHFTLEERFKIKIALPAPAISAIYP